MQNGVDPGDADVGNLHVSLHTPADLELVSLEQVEHMDHLGRGALHRLHDNVLGFRPFKVHDLEESILHLVLERSLAKLALKCFPEKTLHLLPMVHKLLPIQPLLQAFYVNEFHGAITLAGADEFIGFFFFAQAYPTDIWILRLLRIAFQIQLLFLVFFILLQLRAIILWLLLEESGRLVQEVVVCEVVQVGLGGVLLVLCGDIRIHGLGRAALHFWQQSLALHCSHLKIDSSEFDDAASFDGELLEVREELHERKVLSLVLPQDHPHRLIQRHFILLIRIFIGLRLVELVEAPDAASGGLEQKPKHGIVEVIP